MPITGARFRVKTTKFGKKVRLAFKGNKVVEAKNLKTGRTHTQEEFKKDVKRKVKKSMKSLKRGKK
jgi:hypothetical protein